MGKIELQPEPGESLDGRLPRVFAGTGCLGCRCRIVSGFCKVMKVVTGMLLLQVHEVTMDIFNFYEKLREPLTAEMCHRYLEILR